MPADSEDFRPTAPRRPDGGPFRIAIMLPRFSRYGGVEQFGFRLAEALAQRGHQVDFICARQEEEPPAGVRVLPVGRPAGFRVVKMLWFLAGAERLRRKGKYDLSISLGKTWNQDISRMGGGPLRTYWEKSEQALPPGRPRLLKQLSRRLSPSNHLTLALEKHQFTAGSDVVAVSHLVRDWLLEAHPALRPDKVGIIYNKPDTSRFSRPTPEERAHCRATLAAHSDPGRLSDALRLPDGTEPVFIGTASTNFRLKGVEPLIRSLARLPDHCFLFVAGGRDAGEYRALAEELGVSGRVRFLGKVTDMPSFYKALDIFILPTFYDACSNAVLEALASGCKALTSNRNGAAFFLEPEAVLPDPGDVEDMTQRLRLFLDRPAPPPFVWPEEMPTGLDAFVAYVEAKLKA